MITKQEFLNIYFSLKFAPLSAQDREDVIDCSSNNPLLSRFTYGETEYYALIAGQNIEVGVISYPDSYEQGVEEHDEFYLFVTETEIAATRP